MAKRNGKKPELGNSEPVTMAPKAGNTKPRVPRSLQDAYRNPEHESEDNTSSECVSALCRGVRQETLQCTDRSLYSRRHSGPSKPQGCNESSHTAQPANKATFRDVAISPKRSSVSRHFCNSRLDLSRNQSHQARTTVTGVPTSQVSPIIVSESNNCLSPQGT